MWGLLCGTRRGPDSSLKTKIRLITILKITGAVPKKYELYSTKGVHSENCDPVPAPVPHPQKMKNTHIRRIQEMSHSAKEQTMSPLSLCPAELPS